MTVYTNPNQNWKKKAGLPPDSCIQLASHANNMVKLLFNFSDLLHRFILNTFPLYMRRYYKCHSVLLLEEAMVNLQLGQVTAKLVRYGCKLNM